MSVCTQPSNTMTKTYWRSHLYSIMRERKVPRKLLIHGNAFHFLTDNWDEYWKDIPLQCCEHLFKLKKARKEYIDNNIDHAYTRNYCDAYFDLLSSSVHHVSEDGTKKESFLGRVLGFENVVLVNADSPHPFASMTSSIRNPVFLSFQCRGLRNTDRNDPSLLPLVGAVQQDKPWLFYHYRKQRLLHNTDENLLFYPAVDIETRKESFRGFDKLINIFVEPWDSRVDQRSKMIVDKVITSFLQQLFIVSGSTLRILDIGSGDGGFTSRVIGRMKKIGLIGKRKIDLSLLDILSTEPEMALDMHDLMTSLSKVEYISQDYGEWLDGIDVSQCYDIIFLFRILHNVSSFRILSKQMVTAKGNVYRGRYRVYPHLSEYYQAISLLFKEMLNSKEQYRNDSQVYYPSRMFRDSCLMFNDGTSIIDKMCSISKGVLIEDGDLTPEVLIDHLSKYSRDTIYVYDFSTCLRLTVNHIYWITQNKQDDEIPGEKIWPKSGKS